MKQKRYDNTYMKIANDISELSYAQRAKVGCVIVSDEGQILSQGFNGMPSGFDNCCEDVNCNIIDEDERKDVCKQPKSYFCNHIIGYDEEGMTHSECGYVQNYNFGKPNMKECLGCEYCILKTKEEVLHAESNAISKCAKWGGRTEGSTLYVTLSPCKECAKLIAQSGIKRVVYRDLYRDSSGIDFLKKTNIKVEQL